MPRVMIGIAIFAAAALPVNAEVVSFTVPPVHIEFDFSPVNLVSQGVTALPGGDLAETFIGSNSVSSPFFSFNVVQEGGGQSWAAQGWYPPDGLLAQRRLNTDGSSQLLLSLSFSEQALYWGSFSKLKLTYTCQCSDLYSATLDAALLANRVPVQGEAITDWYVAQSAHNPAGGSGTYHALFPAVPEPDGVALVIAGLFAVIWPLWPKLTARPTS